MASCNSRALFCLCLLASAASTPAGCSTAPGHCDGSASVVELDDFVSLLQTQVVEWPGALKTQHMAVAQHSPVHGVSAARRQPQENASEALAALAEANPKNPLFHLELPAEARNVSLVRAALPEDLVAALQTLTDLNPELPAALTCPPENGGDASVNDVNNTKTYTDRFEKGQCEESGGMWGHADAAPMFRSKYETVAELFGLRSGYNVLDWGAGCGHQLDLVAAERGFTAVGVDLVPELAAWARENLNNLATFCGLDATNLTFPDESFDAVLSNGALLHVKNEEGAGCTVLRDQILRVLKPSGCAWIGWNGALVDTPEFVVPMDDYVSCLVGHPDIQAVFAKNEKELFGFSEYDSIDAYSLFFCKKR